MFFTVSCVRPLLVILTSLTLCSCDGGIHVKGRVYSQAGAAGESQAFIDQSNPVHGNLTPVKGAKVTLYSAGDYSAEKVAKSELRKHTTDTEADGSFVVGGLTSPFRFNAGLVVEKDGYKTITKVFRHERLDHEAVIILVPEAETK